MDKQRSTVIKVKSNKYLLEYRLFYYFYRSLQEERDDLINPYWVEDPNLQKGEVDFLTTAETEFWKDLIDAYLRPIDENKEEQVT